MKTRKFKCIGLGKNNLIAWNKYFTIGKIYSENPNPFKANGYLDLFTDEKGLALMIDADQFEEVKEIKLPTAKQVVKSATLDAYNAMNEVFYMTELFDFYRIKNAPNGLKTFQGSITREMRYLRTDGVIDYEVLNNKKSKYQKL